MIECRSKAVPDRPGVFWVAMLVLVVLAGLFLFKWGGAFRTLAKVDTAGTYHAPSELISTKGLPFLVAGGAKTINYLAVVWPALIFGILISGLVRAFVSAEDVAILLGSGVVRQQLMGGVLGMPLMLCSCCIAPIFDSMHTRGMRLRPSLAVMLSSPSLNVAALLLTFMLFPRDMAVARLALALFAVFVLPMIIERSAHGEAAGRVAEIAPERTGRSGVLDWFRNAAAAFRCARVSGEEKEAIPNHPIHVIGRWATASGSVALRTAPLILLGIFASSLVVGSFERPAAPGAPTAITVAGVAFFATLIALPTFFEIPFGLLLLANGFPAGAVVAMLFAGPAINTPSLFTLARVSSKQVAILTFLGVWVTAILGGLLLESWRM